MSEPSIPQHADDGKAPQPEATFTLTAQQLRQLAGGRWGDASHKDLNSAPALLSIAIAAAEDIRATALRMADVASGDADAVDVETQFQRVADRLEIAARLVLASPPRAPVPAVAHPNFDTALKELAAVREYLGYARLNVDALIAMGTESDPEFPQEACELLRHLYDAGEAVGLATDALKGQAQHEQA